MITIILFFSITFLFSLIVATIISLSIVFPKSKIYSYKEIKFSERRLCKKAHTLIELLVVVAIINILLAISLPAVQVVRESSRRTFCLNKINQLTKATIHYESKWQSYPSGGWGNKWLGNQSRQKTSQPGGWTFSILPYIEEEQLYQNSKYYQLETSIFTCPSRRSFKLYDDNEVYYENTQTTKTTRSDYAINGGSAGSCPSIDTFIKSNIKSNADIIICHIPLGNSQGGNSIKQKINTLANGGHRNHKKDHIGPCGSCDQPLDVLMNQSNCQPSTLSDGDMWIKQNFTTRFLNQGICGVMPDITDGIVGRMRIVTNGNLFDGASNIYLIGEKYVCNNKQENCEGDDASLFVGFSNNNIRWGYDPPQIDSKNTISTIFGSSHPVVFNISFADGRTKSVNYDIDPNLHFILSGRNNGNF